MEGTNPIRAWKERHHYRSREVARVLGISEDYARKLLGGGYVGLSPIMAEQFEKRTDGELPFEGLMRWVAAGARARREASQGGERTDGAAA